MRGIVFGEGDMRPALESHVLDSQGGTPFVHQFVQAVLEDSAEPSTWEGNGPLPNQLDGLRQAQIVTAIIESSETGKTISLE